MLVISRKRKQSIIIEDTVTGDRILLTVLQIKGGENSGRVRIGIDADNKYKIIRDELLDDEDL